MRSPAAKRSGEGADQPSYRSERDPAATDMKPTRRRGSGAPRRRWAAQTVRRGAPRKRGPRRLPGRAAGQESLRHDGHRQRLACSRPAVLERALAGATAPAAARQTAKLSMDPCPCRLWGLQRCGHSRMTIQDWKRTQAGPTGAQPPNAGTVSAFGRMPMRNRNRIVARLCARRPGGCRQSRTRKSGWKRRQVCAGAGERSAAERALESSCYSPDNHHQENGWKHCESIIEADFIGKRPC